MADEDELTRVRNERAERNRGRFTHADALELGDAALALARDAAASVVIDVRRGEHVVFHVALDGMTAEHADWVRRKVNTVLRHEIPSYEFLLRQRVAGRVPDWLAPTEFAVAGGAVPITIGSSIVGVITVSGIVASASGDHDLAMSALRATTVQDTTSPRVLT